MVLASFISGGDHSLGFCDGMPQFPLCIAIKKAFVAVKTFHDRCYRLSPFASPANLICVTGSADWTGRPTPSQRPAGTVATTELMRSVVPANLLGRLRGGCGWRGDGIADRCAGHRPTVSCAETAAAVEGRLGLATLIELMRQLSRSDRYGDPIISSRVHCNMAIVIDDVRSQHRS